MSVTPEQSAEALNGMFKFGQSLAAGFFDYLGKQNAAFQQAAPAQAPQLPLPEASDMARLQQELAEAHARLWAGMAQARPGEPVQPIAQPAPGDRRFNAPEWTASPVFDYIRQAYLLNSDYLTKLADALPIADGRTKERMQFLTRQYVDALAPSNFAATNPEFIQTAIETRGESITQGIKNLIADMEKGRISMTDDSAFEIGRNLATTPGSVIYENALMQLIQYAPLTEQVHKTPLLIVPPCINKFYIMDLQPANSLVRFMVEQGFTVFLVSWKNIQAEQAHFGWDDYLQLGPITALDVVRDVTKVKKPHALGFCVGGTILTSALAVLKGRGEDPVESLSLMTTLLDFADAGEIGCLVDEASVAGREATIGKGGVFQGRELAQVFSSLRANDLIWQYVVGNYLKGKKPEAFDLLYWNSDSTNLPGNMYCWYLRHTYLEDKLKVPGALTVCGEKVDIGRIEAPVYLYASREDHIVPWDAAYQSTKLFKGPRRFVLGASGHIAGVVNPPAKKKRNFWTNDELPASADDWLKGATSVPGSWWPDWADWLAQHAGKKKAAPKAYGNRQHKVIEPAPGRYVKQKV